MNCSISIFSQLIANFRMFLISNTSLGKFICSTTSLKFSWIKFKSICFKEKQVLFEKFSGYTIFIIIFIIEDCMKKYKRFFWCMVVKYTLAVFHASKIIFWLAGTFWHSSSNYTGFCLEKCYLCCAGRHRGWVILAGIRGSDEILIWAE